MTNQNPSDKPIEKMSFEECYSELQELVGQFERGQMPLTQSVEKFERGILLLKQCNEQLADAEKRVESLLKRIEPQEMPLNTETSDHSGHDPDDEDIPF